MGIYISEKKREEGKEDSRGTDREKEGGGGEATYVTKVKSKKRQFEQNSIM